MSSHKKITCIGGGFHLKEVDNSGKNFQHIFKEEQLGWENYNSNYATQIATKPTEASVEKYNLMAFIDKNGDSVDFYICDKLKEDEALQILNGL